MGTKKSKFGQGLQRTHHSVLQCTIYSIENIFIALGPRSEMIMGFHKYLTGPKYIIRAVNTKHA